MLKTPPDLAAKQSAGSPAMLDWMNPVDGEIDHEADTIMQRMLEDDLISIDSIQKNEKRV